MTLVQRLDGHWQEVTPSCCMNGHRWRIGDRSFRVVGSHVRAWECQTPGCGSVVRAGERKYIDGYAV